MKERVIERLKGDAEVQQLRSFERPSFSCHVAVSSGDPYFHRKDTLPSSRRVSGSIGYD